MLFTRNPHSDVESLVGELLDRFGSLAEVMSADTDALAAAGLSLPAIAGVKFVREVALRFMRAELRERPVVGSWDKLIEYCSAQLAYSKVEEFHVLFLDRKNALIKDEMQQRGTIDHTPVYPREVIKRALELGASALILVHNHPSGDPSPSKADIIVTQNIIDAAAPLGIIVHDHLIIGRGGHMSLRDRGLILFEVRGKSCRLGHRALYEIRCPRRGAPPVIARGLAGPKRVGRRRCALMIYPMPPFIVRSFWGTFDYLGYILTSMRLTVFDRIYGPGPPSAVD